MNSCASTSDWQKAYLDWPGTIEGDERFHEVNCEGVAYVFAPVVSALFPILVIAGDFNKRVFQSLQLIGTCAASPNVIADLCELFDRHLDRLNLHAEVRVARRHLALLQAWAKAWERVAVRRVSRLYLRCHI